VTSAASSAAPRVTGWRAVWGARPSRCSRPLWALVIVLNRLPWPWGEEILARLYVSKALVSRVRLRRALRWSSAHSDGATARWRLAARVCSYYGRFVSRLMLVGFRDPDHLRAHLVVRGEEHLKGAAGRGIILLGFHLGPPGAALALRIVGHPLTWARGWDDSQGGSGEAWRRFHATGEMLSLSQGGKSALGGVLYEARRVLLEGGTIYITADGGRGREAFRLPVPGTPVIVRSGWLALCRHTGATVLPVLTHLEGRTQVVTIHPALPPIGRHPAQGLEACREALRELLDRYVREHPEQCYSLVFRGGRKKKRRGSSPR
jgi:lauroyl/myristoyl acyltransferase